MRLAALPFFIFLNVVSFGQSSESIQKKLEAAPNDSTKVLLINNYVNSIRENDNETAIQLSLQALEIAERINFKKGLAVALENLGWLNYRKDNYLEVLKYSLDAFRINQQIGNKRGMANCLNNIAAVYYEKNQFKEAIKSFRAAFQLAKEAGEPAIMGRSYNNIAFCLIGLNQLDSAEYYCDLAIRFSKASKDHFRVAFGYRTSGDLFVARKKYKEALEEYKKALAESSDSFIQGSTLHRAGGIYLKLGDFDSAEKYLMANLRIASEHNYRSEIATNYKLLAEVYMQKQDKSKSIYYLKQYVTLNDSLTDERGKRQTAMMQAKYDDEKSKAQLELMSREAQLRDKEILVQRTLIYVFAGALIVVWIMVFGLIRSNRNRKQANFLLKERNRLIDHQKQELIGLNATKDKIFSIIGHDLRSPLATLRGLMDLVSNQSLSKEEFIELSQNLKLNLEYVHEDMDNLLNWARTQLKGFEPSPSEVDLLAAVEEKIQLLSESAKSKAITLQSNVEEGTTVLIDKNNLDLILRNLLGNAIKFSLPAGTVTISSSIIESMCAISVTDTGIGLMKEEVEKLFHPESHFSKPGTNREKGLGIGLLLVKEFVEKNGGTISVSSEPGKGSVFTFTVKAISFPNKNKKKEEVESINH
jgi:two-component system sensor histidine kinase/response regulator